MTVQGKILKWGNSYAVRLRKTDVERLGLRVGDHIDLPLLPTVPPLDWPTFHAGGLQDRGDAATGALLGRKEPV